MSTEAIFEKYIKQPDPQQKIWRYMDFTKFVSLLDTRSLFFPQARKLGDKFEGHMRDIPPESELWNMLKTMRNDPRMPDYYIVISCWHLNDYESAAMWKQYLTSNEGIAIQSTSESLLRNIDISQKTFYHGLVNYGDALLEAGEMASIEYFYFYKRKSFEHEKEYRVLVPSPQKMDEINKNGGKYFAVDLNSLIEKIYIAPETPKWFTDLVISIKAKNGIDAEVIQSELDKDWLI